MVKNPTYLSVLLGGILWKLSIICLFYIKIYLYVKKNSVIGTLSTLSLCIGNNYIIYLGVKKKNKIVLFVYFIHINFITNKNR